MIYENFHRWFEQARKEGRKVGLQEGRMEGREEGRKEGQVEALQKALLRMLSKRFGPLPSQISQRVEQISSVTKLQNLVDRALEVESLQELRLR